MYIRLMILLGFSCISTTYAVDYYVATNGVNSNAGTSISSPFRTIQKAADVMQAGDRCMIREGTYRETIDLSQVNGSAGHPITFTSYNGEPVVIDGRIPVASEWTLYEGQIYKCTVTEDIFQLFIGEAPLTLARFPNVKAWSDDAWVINKSRRFFKKNGSSNGTLVDDPGEGHPDTLAASGVDFTGAIAVINNGQWTGKVANILSHSAGSNTFTYDLYEHTYLETYPYYFIEGFQALDAPGEWWYNPDEDLLYYWPEDGANPTGQDFQGRTRTYTLLGESGGNKGSYLVFDGLTFFAGGFYFYGNDSITIENCAFDYPASAKRTLGVLVAEPGFYSNSTVDFVFRNNTVWRSELEWNGLNMVRPIIENNYISEISPAAGNKLEGNSIVSLRDCDQLVVRRNTFDTFACANAFTATHAFLVEYNLFNRSSLIQGDAMSIQVSHTPIDSILRYNWFLNSNHGAYRYDGKGMPDQIFGNSYRNVTYGGDGTVKIKGDYHTVYHVTGNIEMRNDKGGNTNTKVANCASRKDLKTGEGKREDGGPKGQWEQITNWDQVNDSGTLNAQLVAPDLYDFRPKADSPWVDGGTVIPGLYLEDGTFVPGGINDGFVGDAPDIGAYERGAENYWIPGYQAPQASMPIPSDGATGMLEDRELFWLGGYQGTAFDVYFGSNENDVAMATQASPEYQGTQTNNIFEPNFTQDGECFWRIDTITPDGTVTGEVWRFSVDVAEVYTNLVSASVSPLDDAFVLDGDSTNYGSEIYLRARNYQSISSRMSFLKFNVGDLDGGRIVSASLSVRTEDAAIDNLTVRSVNNNLWEEETLTGQNFPTIGGALSTINTLQPETWYTLDATDFVTNSGSWSLALTTTHNIGGLDFSSKESAYPPELVIRYSNGGSAADVDVDGLPDAWEVSHLGSPTNSNGMVDSDDDGVSNADEFEAGTDPSDSTSLLEISEFTPQGDTGVRIRWQSASNKFYTLSSITNLLQGDWVPIRTNIIATPPNNEEEVLPLTTNHTHFFRIEVE